MTVCELDKCNVCGACLNVCPVDAITLIDNVKEVNAIINVDKCIKCNRCHKICPVNNTPALTPPMAWMQGWAIDENIRHNGASGGVATAISIDFINNGGIVVGCVLNSGDFIFKVANTLDELDHFCGSKYVKSNSTKIYSTIKFHLINKKKVLFIGLPCQIAGLKNYIDDDLNDYLYTIDLICHGTPSVKLLKSYLYQCGVAIEELDDLVFRYKTNNSSFLGNNYVSLKGTMDSYTIAFLKSMTYTNNCYYCSYASDNRLGDLTLGDSWGSDLPKNEVEKGISLVLCQTLKGQSLLEQSKICLKKVDRVKALASNAQLKSPSAIPPRRNDFFYMYNNLNNLDRVVAFFYPKMYVKQQIKRIMTKLNLWRRGGMKFELICKR